MQKKNEQKKESVIGNIIGVLLIILVIPLLVVFVPIAIQATTNPEELPGFMGYKPLICASNSMGNIFQLGDLTITKEIPQNELKKGDIITFWNSDRTFLITHRVEEITIDENGKRLYITKGDMNKAIDEEAVEFEQIEGKYVGHIKYVGNLILILQEPKGLIIAFLIPLFICALVYRHNLKIKEMKSKRTEKLLKRIEEKNKKQTLS